MENENSNTEPLRKNDVQNDDSSIVNAEKQVVKNDGSKAEQKSPVRKASKQRSTSNTLPPLQRVRDIY